MKYFHAARDAAIQGIRSQAGAPFGAAIVRDDEIVSAASNTATEDMDPTAHAEMVVIRRASKILGQLDLSGCVMYATAQPCPMCIAAMMVAGIDECYFASTGEDVAAAGLPSNNVREYLTGTMPDAFSLVQVEDARAECAVVWDEWKNSSE